MLALELAEEERDELPARARSRRRSRACPRSVALVGGELLEQLLLELEHPLRAPVEAPARLGRLDAAAGAVEQLLPEALLERAHLQADRGLGHAEALGRLREALAVDDGAEGRELPRVHKQPLYQSSHIAACRRRGGRESLRRRARLDDVRVWIDITGPAHVLVFRPLIGCCASAAPRWRSPRAITPERRAAPPARDAGRGRGRARRPLAGGQGGDDGDAAGRPRALGARAALRRRPRARLARADAGRAALRIPSSTTFDYEFAALQHQLGCRAATRVVVPEAIPPDVFLRYGLRPPKLRRIPA